MNSDHLASHLIVAKESLDDRNFSRTVVLLIQHDDDGTFGVVLNRMLPVGLETIWEQLSETTSVIDRPVHAGGPVEGPLMCLHESP
ncbi:MAG: YqgE/AlgH family protein, partial [Planctomycetota bacterium]